MLLWSARTVALRPAMPMDAAKLARLRTLVKAMIDLGDGTGVPVLPARATLQAATKQRPKLQAKLTPAKRAQLDAAWAAFSSPQGTVLIFHGHACIAVKDIGELHFRSCGARKFGLTVLS